MPGARSAPFLMPVPPELHYKHYILMQEAYNRSSQKHPVGISAYSKVDTLYSPRRHVDRLHQRVRSASSLRLSRPQLHRSTSSSQPNFPPLTTSISMSKLDDIRRAREARRARDGKTPDAARASPAIDRPSRSSASQRPWLCAELQPQFDGQHQVEHAETPPRVPRVTPAGGHFSGGVTASTDSIILNAAVAHAAPPSSLTAPASSTSSLASFGAGADFGAASSASLGGPKLDGRELPWASLFRQRAEPAPERKPATASQQGFDMSAIGKAIEPPHTLGWNYWISGASTAHWPVQLHAVGYKPGENR